MSRIDLVDLANLENESTAVGAVNVNNEVLEEIMDKALFRTGESPNHMQAELDMNSNRIINLPAAVAGSGDPVRASDLTSLIPDFASAQLDIDAAEQAAVDAQNAAAQAIAAASSIDVGTLGVQDANAVNISGGAISGTIITGIPDPLVLSDLSNKRYSDKQNPENARVLVRLATAATLPNSPTYTAATSSVLDILEATTNGALVVDGVTVADGDRILVKNQATAAHNNVYVSSTVGSHWKLTRVSDLDEGVRGEAFYVNEGSTNAGKHFARVNSSTPNYYVDTILAVQTTDFPTKGQFEDITRTVTSNTSSIASNTASIASNTSSIVTVSNSINSLSNTFTYPSISSAQLATVPKAVKTIVLTGYYNNGDTPKAYYKRVNSQPSHPGRFRSTDRYLSTEVVDSTNGGWWELIETEVDLRMLGAIGDGAHAVEDTLAWSNACDMHNANKLFHLRIPPNSTILINQNVFNIAANTKELTIEGYGSSSIVKAANSAALNSILNNGPDSGGLTLKNFVFDGNRHNTGMAHPSPVGGVIVFADNLRMIGMEFKEFAFAGVVLFSAVGDPLVNNVFVENCYFHDIGYVTDESGGGNPYANLGVSMFGGADNVTLLNNRFIDIHGLIEPIGDSNAFNLVGDNHIAIGNYCRNCHNGRGGMFGMGAANSKKVIVIGNVVEQTVYFASERSNGIAVETDAGGYWKVADNVIIGAHGAGISTGTTSLGFSITNNVIKDWGCNGETNAYAIYANQDVTFGKISGNIFRQSAGSGLYGILVNTTGGNIIVSDNAFDGNISVPNSINNSHSAIVMPNNLNCNNTMHVADLPGAAGNSGLRLTVNDSNTTTFRATVAGGGTDIVGVVAGDGVWRVG